MNGSDGAPASEGAYWTFVAIVKAIEYAPLVMVVLVAAAAVLYIASFFVGKSGRPS